MRAVLLLALAVLSAAVITTALRDEGDTPARKYVAEHPVDPPAISRTVFVSVEMPRPSATPKRLSARLERGVMPAATTTAEVLTDTECTPDGKMISRCRNVMELADGSRLVLRHPHEMSKVPCLAPGEQVRLVPQPA